MTPLCCRTSLAVGLVVFLQGTSVFAGQAEEKARVEGLVQAVADALRTSKIDQANEAADHARNSSELSDPYRGLLLQRLGLLYLNDGRFDKAKEFLKDALKVRDGLAPHYILDKFLSQQNLGVLYRRMENYALSAHHFEECEKLLSSDRAGKITPIYQAAFRSNLGYMYELTGLNDRARDEYDRSLELLEGVRGAELERAYSLSNRGWLHIRIGKEEQRKGNGRADETARRAREQFDKAGKDLNAAQDLVSRLKRSSASMTPARRENLHSLAVETANRLGLLALLLEQYEEAEK